MTSQHLNVQMRAFATRLLQEVKLETEATQKLATTIAADVRFLSSEHKDQIRNATPVHWQDRLAELQAFQRWMEIANTVKNPFVTRAQVLTQNYVCFVYLPESCFRVLAKACPSGSATRKCAKFLNTTPIRAFRNAIAHANWTYRRDFEAIVYFARVGDRREEPLSRFEVTQTDLAFWQALSRCVSYVTLFQLVNLVHQCSQDNSK